MHISNLCSSQLPYQMLISQVFIIIDNVSKWKLVYVLEV